MSRRGTRVFDRLCSHNGVPCPRLRGHAGLLLYAVVVLLGGVLIDCRVTAAPPAYVPSLIRRNADPSHPVKFSQQSSQDGRAVTLTLVPTKDEFTVELEFDDVHLQKLMFVIKHPGEPSRLDYLFRAKREISLLGMKGSEITARGDVCQVTLSRAALSVLPPGGKLHYVGPRPKETEKAVKAR